MRDMDCFRAAFTELKALGYWARTNQEDGWHAVPKDILKRSGKLVFWNATATPLAFDTHGNLCRPLYLQHLVRDTDEILRICAQHGLQVQEASHNGVRSVTVLPRAANLAASDGQPTFKVEALPGRRFAYQGPQAPLEFAVTEVDVIGEMLRVESPLIPGGWATLPAGALRVGLFNGQISEILDP